MSFNQKNSPSSKFPRKVTSYSYRSGSSKISSLYSEALTSSSVYNLSEETLMASDESEDSCKCNPDFPDCNNYRLSFANKRTFQSTEDEKDKPWPFPPERCTTTPIHEHCTLNRDKCTDRKYFSYHQNKSRQGISVCPQARKCSDYLHDEDCEETAGHWFQKAKIIRSNNGKKWGGQSKNVSSTKKSSSSKSDPSRYKSGNGSNKNNALLAEKTKSPRILGRKQKSVNDKPKRLSMNDNNEILAVPIKQSRIFNRVDKEGKTSTSVTKNPRKDVKSVEIVASNYEDDKSIDNASNKQASTASDQNNVPSSNSYEYTYYGYDYSSL